VLQEAAFRSAGRLTSPPESLLSGIRRSLWTMAADGRLYNERAEIRARVQRLRTATSVANALSVSEALPRVVLAIVVCLPAISALFYPSRWELCAFFALCGVVLELRNTMIVLHGRSSALPKVVRIGAGAGVVGVFNSSFIFATRSMLASVALLLWSRDEMQGISVGLMCAVLLPLLLGMSAHHCAEHGCAKAPRAFIAGWLLVVRHSLLGVRWPAFRSKLVKWYSDRLWRDAETWLVLAVAIAIPSTIGALMGLAIFLQSKEPVVFYILAGCIFLIFLLIEALSMMKRYAGRIRVRNLRSRTQELTVDYLITVLSAVASTSEMHGVIRAVRQGFSPLSAGALQLLTDLSSMREAIGDYDELIFQSSMAAWLSSDEDAVKRALRFFTYEDADDVARIADKAFRDGAVRPLNQQTSQTTL
jgi:hypothetical protein